MASIELGKYEYYSGHVPQSFLTAFLKLIKLICI